MDVPYFIQHPPTANEIETLLLLMEGKTVKEVAALRHLSLTTIQGHTKNLRFKFHSSTLCGVVGLMTALGYIKPQHFRRCLPPVWEQYRLTASKAPQGIGRRQSNTPNLGYAISR